MLGSRPHGPEFMLGNPHGGPVALRPHDAPGNMQLHGRHVLQQYRPGDRQLDIQSNGQ